LFARGTRPQRADNDIHLPNPTFPEVPPGIKILSGRNLPNDPYLVKIGKYVHMQTMIETGEIRIAPASSYADKSLAIAIRDNELEILAHYAVADIHKTALGRSAANKIDLKRSGEITIKRTLPDFYAYCLAHRYDHRLLDDFKADTIVLIKEPVTFLNKLVEAVKLKYPNQLPRVGAVDYYDPYFVEDWSLEAEGFIKHFRYAYQNEFRVCWNRAAGTPQTLAPFYVRIGDMRKYGELLTLQNSQQSLDFNPTITYIASALFASPVISSDGRCGARPVRRQCAPLSRAPGGAAPPSAGARASPARGGEVHPRQGAPVQRPWRLPALHSLFGGRGKRDTGLPGAKNAGNDACPDETWLFEILIEARRHTPFIPAQAGIQFFDFVRDGSGSPSQVGCSRLAHLG
jgi:hypothetical protein